MICIHTHKHALIYIHPHPTINPPKGAAAVPLGAQGGQVGLPGRRSPRRHAVRFVGLNGGISRYVEYGLLIFFKIYIDFDIYIFISNLIRFFG